MNFIHEHVPGTSPWTLLLLHGTGGDQHDLLPLGRALMPDASLLSPLGKVSENGAARFFRRFAEGVFDMEDLVYRTNELGDWLESLIIGQVFDPNRAIAVGYSNGATMASSLLLLRPELIRGAIALRPSVPLVPEPLPTLTAKHVLLVPGMSDSIVPASQADELMKIFASAEALPTLARQQAGHGLTPSDVTVARSWLETLVESDTIL